MEPAVREGLVACRSTTRAAPTGAGTRSHPARPLGPAAGRLFLTSLSILTLEVYYRYLPLYRTVTTTRPSPARR